MIIFHAHSGLRYLALLAGLAVIAYGIRALAGKKGHDDTLYNLAGIYRLIMDVTLFLGVALLFTGRFYPAVGTHSVIPSSISPSSVAEIARCTSSPNSAPKASPPNTS